jgi:hypothetical protein
MPFARKGAAALTERLDVGVAPEDKEQLRRIAASAGISVAVALPEPSISRGLTPVPHPIETLPEDRPLSDREHPEGR